MLKGSREGLSIPLDASLYGALGQAMKARDALTEYVNCECVMTDKSVEAVLSLHALRHGTKPDRVVKEWKL
ncbi:hypothetical protein [Archaeoglobus sp.]